MVTNNPDQDTLIDIYSRVALIRQTDDRIVKSLRAGKFAAPYYSPRGQECIPSAISVNLRDDDYICTIYRGFHDMLAKGMPLKDMWAEIAGKATGTCKGKGGPMHLTYPSKGIMITTGVVGSSMPIANGLALASKLDGNDRVTIAYFGDGASNIGAFHEALNLAAVWKLPVIFVCQNNQFGEHTIYEKATSSEQIAQRSASYGMPGVRVDGNDPVAVYRAAVEAIDRARAGDGPSLIEGMTFRFRGHILGDDDSYMDPARKQAAVDADPVPVFRAKLIGDGVASEERLKDIEDGIEIALDDAEAFAYGSAYPDASELRADVYETEMA